MASIEDSIKAVLSNPIDLPLEFKQWIKGYLEINPPRFLPGDLASQIAGANIKSGSISADKLEAVLSLVSSLVAGDPAAVRVEIGYGVNTDGTLDDSFTGIRAYDGSGTLIFKLDAGGGTAQFKGRVYFGSLDPDAAGGSRLTTNDMIQVAEQSSGAYQTPALQQGTSATGSDVSGVTATWDQATISGNELILIVTTWDPAGNASHTAPAGWTSIKNNTFDSSNGRLQVYRRSGTGDSGDVAVTFDKSVDNAIVQLLEFSGVQDVEDGASATSSGSGATGDTGTSGALTQQDLVLGVFSLEGNYSFAPPVFPVVSSVDAGWDQIAFTYKRKGASSGSHLATGVWMEIASSGTQGMSAIALSAVDAWRGMVLTFKAKTNAVDSADANSVRLYAEDVGGNSQVHTVDESGNQRSVALAPSGQLYNLEKLTGTLNMASRAAHSGGSETLNVTGVNVGDIVVACHPIDATDVRSFLIHPEPVVTVVDQVQLIVFNTDAAVRDPASTTFHVTVIHTS